MNGIKMHCYQAQSWFVCIVLSTIASLNSILNINLSTVVQGDMPDVHLTYNSACTSEACTCRPVLPYYRNKLWAEGLSKGGRVVNLIFGIEQHLISLE